MRAWYRSPSNWSTQSSALEDTRTGDRSVLRHVTNQEQRDAGLLADAKEPRGGLLHCETDLGADPTSGEYRVWTESMHADGRPLTFERRADRVQVRLGEDLNPPAPPRRVARSLTCAFDSSPVTSSARRLRETPRAPSAGASTSPRPAPRRRVRGRRDSPPPRTRSSSGTPVGIRSASSTSTSTSRSTGRGAPPSPSRPAAPPPPVFRSCRSRGSGRASDRSTGRIPSRRT